MTFVHFPLKNCEKNTSTQLIVSYHPTAPPQKYTTSTMDKRFHLFPPPNDFPPRHSPSVPLLAGVRPCSAVPEKNKRAPRSGYPLPFWRMEVHRGDGGGSGVFRCTKNHWTLQKKGVYLCSRVLLDLQFYQF